MAHEYEAHGHDGKIYDVTTSEHHSNHTDETFKQHLGRVIDGALGGTASGIATALIVRYVFKGKK